MTTQTKKREIKKLVKEMLKESHQASLKQIDKAINCGALDIDSWDGKYVIPKTIVTAILEDGARQYLGTNTCFEKQVRKDANNLKRFL